jgi:hypothetical protein
VQRLVALIKNRITMKKIFFIFSIISSIYSYGQCVNLYIKEHLDGDPICLLSNGSILEICLDSKTITGGSCTFYIQSSRMNGDVQTYEFGLDKSTMYFYAPKYGDLMINTKTRKFGFIIDNNSGAYSYYNEAEMQKIREAEKVENEKRAQERKKEEERLKELDKPIIKKITDLMDQKKIEEAAIEYSNLKISNRDLEIEIQIELNKMYEDSVVNLSQDQLQNYIQDYLKSKKIIDKERERGNQYVQDSFSLGALNPGEYTVKFDKNGKPAKLKVDNLHSSTPVKKIGLFKIYFESNAIFKIEYKDSVLVSTTYSTSNTKPLFIDKNENFFFKTKTGLPIATITKVTEREMLKALDRPHTLSPKEVLYSLGNSIKLVLINKTYKREKYANGILIDSQEFKTEKLVLINKKG